MDSALKVLILVHGFPPHQMAGAEIYAQKTALALRDLGADILVVCPGQNQALEEYEIYADDDHGLRVLRVNNNYRDLHALEDTYANSKAEAVLDSILADEAPDIVHVHHTIGTSSGAIDRAKDRGIKVVVTLHDFWFHCARGQRLTPRNHLCQEVQLWRCNLCLAKKRARYSWNYFSAYWQGASRDTTGRPWIERILLSPMRFLKYAWRQWLQNPLKRRHKVMMNSLNRADLVLAPSHFMLKAYLEEGLDPALAEFSEYGMDTAPFKELRNGLSDLGDDQQPCLQFGFVGTLIPSKGVEVLVRAFQLLPEGRAKLKIFGAPGGPNGPRFEAKLKRLNQHSDLSFEGRFQNSEVARVLGELDVLIVPSLWFENSPLTLHEAVMAEKVSITSDHGGMAELAERFGNSRTFEAGNAKDLARVMLAMIDDPSVVEGLRKPQRQVRSIPDDAAHLLKKYEQLLVKTKRT